MKLNLLIGTLLSLCTIANAYTYYLNTTLPCPTDSNSFIEPSVPVSKSVSALFDESSGTPTVEILADGTQTCLPTLDYEFSPFGCQVACPSAVAAAANTELSCNDLVNGYHDEFVYCLRCQLEISGFSNTLSEAAINKFIDCGINISCDITSSSSSPSSLTVTVPSTTATPTITTSLPSTPPLTTETTSIVTITSYTTHSTVSGTITVTVVEPCETTTVTVVICPITSDSTTSYSTSTLTEELKITSKYTSYVTLTSYSTRSTVTGTVTVTLIEPCEITETLVVEPVTLSDTTVLSTSTVTLVSSITSNTAPTTLVVEEITSSDVVVHFTSTVSPSNVASVFVKSEEVSSTAVTESKKITSYITVTSYLTSIGISGTVTYTIVVPSEVPETLVIEEITSSDVLVLSTSTLAPSSEITNVPVTEVEEVISYVTLTSYLTQISTSGTVTQTFVKPSEVLETLVIESIASSDVTLFSTSTVTPSKVIITPVSEPGVTVAFVSESITSYITLTFYQTQTFSVGTSIVSVVEPVLSTQAIVVEASTSSSSLPSTTSLIEQVPSGNVSGFVETQVTQVNKGNHFMTSLNALGVIFILILAI